MIIQEFGTEFSSKIKNQIPVYKDWPTKGVDFLDTVALCKEPTAFKDTVSWYSSLLFNIKSIVSVEARGFIWGSALAEKNALPNYLVRKPGKLPGKVYSQSYSKEYGDDTIEMSASSVIEGPVLIVDDVLATGGTTEAVCGLLHDKFNVSYSDMTVAVLVNLTFLSGKSRLTELGVNVVSLIDE